MMTHNELAQQIINKIGGKTNIVTCIHCITRVRFTVADVKKIKIEEIRKLDGVLGAQFQGGQFQVVIGDEVVNIYNEVIHIIGELTAQAANQMKQGNIIEIVLGTIASIFTPLLPAITGGGLIKVIMALAVVFGWISADSEAYAVLNAIADAPFYFLPFLIAYSAAGKFKTNQGLAVALAGILMYPTFINNAAEGIKSLDFFFIRIPMANYSSTMLPILLGVLLMSYVQKLLRKVIPKSLDIVFVPMLTLIIAAPVTLVLIAPVGSAIGVYLASLFTWLFETVGPLAGALLGGFLPFIIVAGMHYAFIPSCLASLEKYGYENMLLPINLVNNVAQAGATLAVFIKTRDKKMKQTAFTSFLPALLGITEPAMYGVTMKLQKPLYASMIGSAAGGLVFGLFKVKTFSFALPGILALPTYIDKTTANFIYALAGVSVSFVVAFVMTFILKFNTGESLDEIAAGRSNNESANVPEDNKTIEGTHFVRTPISGKVVSLSEAPDQTFASESIGKGIGIIPEDGMIRAPFKGEIIMTTQTNHAIGLISDDGIELLIHIGIDTVNLNGQGFKRYFEQGDKVNQDDLILSFDLDKIRAAKLSTFTPIIVTNTPRFLDIVPAVKLNTKVEAGRSDLLVAIK